MRTNLLLLVIFLILIPTLATAQNRRASQTLLYADFEDKAVDEPIGTGGAEVGEPVSLHGFVATVRDTPMPTRCLSIRDDDEFGAGWAWFEFIGGLEITEGIVHIAVDLWFPAFEGFIFSVRERGSAAQDFVSMWFTSTGKVHASDKDSGYLGVIGDYAVGRVFPIELVYNMDAGTYDVILDGVVVVHDEPHGVVSRGVGSVLIGTQHDQNLDGTINVDNLHVFMSAVLAVEETTWGRIKALYRE